MGRKSSAKAQTTSSAAPPPSDGRSRGPLLIVGLVAIVVALAIGGFAHWRQSDTPAAADAAAGPAPAQYPQPITQAHPQAELPPLAFPAYQPPRPPETIRAAYRFAAEHPEVLSYVPCFCGCERSGHRGNEDCFVRERAVTGDVIAWEDHGMECAVCLDVADRSRRLFEEGASVKRIRETIEREFGGHAPSHTPTPAPPGD